MQINLVLLFVALLMLGGAVKGWKRGMVKEISSLIGLIGGLAAAALFVAAVENYREKDNREMLVAVICFIIVVLAYKIIDFVLTSLKLLTHLPVISRIDRLAGIVIGAGEGILLVWIAFLLITAFDVFGLRGYLLSGIQENEYLMFIFYHNFIAELIARWSGSTASVMGISVADIT